MDQKIKSNTLRTQIFIGSIEPELRVSSIAGKLFYHIFVFVVDDGLVTPHFRLMVTNDSTETIIEFNKKFDNSKEENISRQ